MFSNRNLYIELKGQTAGIRIYPGNNNKPRLEILFSPNFANDYVVNRLFHAQIVQRGS